MMEPSYSRGDIKPVETEYNGTRRSLRLKATPSAELESSSVLLNAQPHAVQCTLIQSPSFK